jgi:GNAT superfamily N-acetyltransferase
VARAARGGPTVRLVAGIDAGDPRLARGFPDASTRAWTMARTCSSLDPVSLAVEDDAGHWIAGMTVAYRSVVCGGGRETVGVLAGAWATPDARGRGTFEVLLDGAIARGTTDGATALLGVMTEHNPNRRRLEARGAELTPTSYAVASPFERPREDASVTPDASDADTLRLALTEARAAHAAFAYDDEAAFAGQFLARPRRAHACVAAGVTAIVEVREGENHVLALLSSDARARRDALAELRHAASHTGQRLAAFGVGAPLRAELEGDGFRVMRGVLARVPCGAASGLGPLALEAGDVP